MLAKLCKSPISLQIKNLGCVYIYYCYVLPKVIFFFMRNMHSNFFKNLNRNTVSDLVLTSIHTINLMLDVINFW